MNVVQVTAKSLVQSELPTLQIDSTRRTTHPSIQDKVYLRQLCQWDKFERDARLHFESQQFSETVLGYTGPEPESDISRKEVFLCGDESSVVGRYGQHVGHVMTTVFQNAESLHDVSFGDFKAQKAQKNLEKYFDIAVGQKGSLFFVGEAKTPWLHPLGGSIYSDKNGRPFRKLLGQICGYMNDLGLGYGFLTTYEQTIFLKRETHAKNSDALKHNLVLWHSPVIYHNTSSQIPEGATSYLDYRKKVSLRECFLYLVSLARQDLEQKNSDSDAKRKKKKEKQDLLARQMKYTKLYVDIHKADGTFPDELSESSSNEGNPYIDQRAKHEKERAEKDAQRQENRRPRH